MMGNKRKEKEGLFPVSLPGTKHFLLMCSVKAEDAGEIHFVSRDVESTAYLEVEGQSLSS